MIDRERFRENFIYLDKEVVIEIIDIFLSEYVERLSAIQKNITEQDFTRLKFNAHSLKGVIANFMDPVSIELSRKLDEHAKNETSKGLQELYNNLKRETESLAKELQEIKADFT
ncbi:MAG: Hpt domain-containing protein [Bacteroidales bacterium]|nr:Hpt domain-containing protein [Bacteroidales bacterium]